jgi:ABC-type uncharacterized transport system substrate-binding protein
MSRLARGAGWVVPRMRLDRATLLRVGLLGAFLLYTGTATAHPHAWIDLRVSLLFDDAGELYALRQEWVFDPSYSHLLLEDMDASQPGLGIDTALRKMTERMLENLREYDYFTEIRRNERRLDIAEARNAELLWRQRRLHLRFELPLEPIRPNRAQPLQYRVYDPSYWIEVLHDPDDVIHLEGARGCEARVERARPEGWLVAYAATLSRDQRAPIEDLGRSFAEAVFIQCDER